MSWSHSSQKGFALPTVVIATVVMLMILVTTVASVTSARVSLDAQYDEQRLRDAGESGSARAEDCLGNSQMTLNVVVTPATNCDGSAITGRSQYILNTPNFRTSYEIRLIETTVKSKKVAVVGKIDALRTSTGAVAKSRTLNLTQSSTMVMDPSGDRVSQRYWYFGNDVIMDFGMDGNAMPTFSRNTATATNLAEEGTTVVTDSSGNLAFWTDGLTIWNKNGAVMSNSTGLTGASSATQAVASFPLDQAQTKFGVVSNSAMAETGFGELYLSVIDMNLNSGLGGVTTKNVKLGSGTGYAGEALNAMPNADGSGYYVYTYNSVAGTLTRFLIKTTGAVEGPYTTTFSPATIKCRLAASGMSGYGTINFSKDYSRMLVLVGSYGCNGTNGGGATDSGRAYIYNANPSSGALSLQTSWVTSGLNTNSGAGRGGYSADFSPLENYVYVSQIYGSSLTRYNIQDTSATAIKNSEWIIGDMTSATTPDLIYESGGHIRLGPDGRMWMTDRAISYIQGAPASIPCKMSYINAPDSNIESISGIGLKIDAITLPAGSCSVWGLPQVATVFKPKIVLY